MIVMTSLMFGSVLRDAVAIQIFMQFLFKTGYPYNPIGLVLTVFVTMTMFFLKGKKSED